MLFRLAFQFFMQPRGFLLSEVGYLQRVAEGQPVAVEQCIAHYGGLVWTLARRMCNTAADAEDAVQEIFIQLWQQAARFDAQRGSEASFVAMIARRRLIDRLRKQQRRPDMDPLVDPPTESSPAAADWAVVSDEAAYAREQMQTLKSDERQVLELALQTGLTQSQIAEHLQMPLGTVKTHARRGLVRLRELMGATPSEKGGVL